MRKHWRALLAALAVLLAFFAIFQLRAPYYFLQDDNRTFSLPAFSYAYETLAGHGRFALYNFHQLLGVPVFQETPVFYPFVYVSVFLSKLFFGHAFASLDIIVLFHLCLALCGFFMLMRRFGAEEGTAALGALFWSLNGYVVFTATSSWLISASAAYFPWVIYFAEGLLRGPAIKTVVLSGVARALLFSVAHHQFFAYAMIMEAAHIGASLCFRREGMAPSRRVIKSYFLSLLVFFILCLPLLWAVLSSLAGSAGRGVPQKWADFSFLDFSFLSWLLGLVWPFSGKLLARYSNWPHMVQLSHIGYVALAFLGAVLWRLYKKQDLGPRRRDLQVFCGLSLFAWLWTMGVFNPVEYYLPVLNRFRWHFKIGLFMNFYLVLAAALGMDYFLSTVRSEKRKIVFWGLAVAAGLNFTALYTLGPRATFRTFSDPVPLTEPLLGRFAGGRMFTEGFPIGYAHSLSTDGYNYATLFGLSHFGGYGQLVPALNAAKTMGVKDSCAYNSVPTPEMIAALRKWGVKWHIVGRKMLRYYVKPLYDAGLVTVDGDAYRVVFADSAAEPMAFTPSGPLAFAFKGDRVSVETAGQRVLTVNVLYNPYLRARTSAGETARVSQDDWGRAAISFANAAQSVELYYENPIFRRGLALSVLLAAAFALLYIFRREWFI